MNAPTTSARLKRGSTLPKAVLRRAERLCADAGERLTPARTDAYSMLRSQTHPVSAYALLALLEKKEGRKIAPLTVYRHLDFLMRVGLVHKLTSTQEYMACEHPEHPHDSLYLVCSSCGKADELESGSLIEILGKAAKSRGFKPAKPIVEVPGLCQLCSQKA